MKDFNDKYSSKSNRLKNFDYSKAYWYFVTICTSERKLFLGNITNNRLVLNNSGVTAETCLKNLTDHFNIIIDDFVVMPNHVHAVIILESRDLIHQVSENNRNSKSPKGDLINQISTKEINLMKQPNVTLGKVIRSYKAKVSYKIRKEANKDFAWQSNYYDHVIRNEKDLFRIRTYIKNNPLKWELDKYYKTAALR